MENCIKMNQKIFDVITEHPELQGTLIDVGFEGLEDRETFRYLARDMTLMEGSAKWNVPVEDVVNALEDKGYKVEDVKESSYEQYEDDDDDYYANKIEYYIRRLNEGGNVGFVYNDIKDNFMTISVHDIIRTTEILKERGFSEEEIDRFCAILEQYK
jgi:hypothetical protein